MNNKVYIAGDMLTKGSQMLRAKEKNDIIELGFDYYNPTDNKEINDKANLDNNDGLAEKIVKADTNGIMSSNIVVIEPQPFALGTMVELGQIKGMKDVANLVSSAINSNDKQEDIIKKISDIVTPICEQKVYPHYEDIRRFKDCVESGDRRALGINQYVYGVCLDLTNNVGFYEWEEVLDELKKLKQPKHKVYCVMGRTASGKTELAKQVAKDLGLELLKSYTTRKPRKEEIGNPDIDHVFISDEEADTMLSNPDVEVIAYTEINNVRYFATLEQLKHSDFYVIDPLGYKHLLKELERRDIQDIEVIPMYIVADYHTRKERYVERNRCSLDDFIRRNQSEHEQFSDFEFDMIADSDLSESVIKIKNIGEFKDAVEEIKEILQGF